MEILFNKKFMDYNQNETRGDGNYRIKEFVDKYPDTPVDFDPMPFIQKVHTKEYLEFLKSECETNGYMAEVDLTPETYDLAVLSVGLTILASETNNFAVCRPSGHHARANFGMGFCFLNNDAIVAKKLLDEGKRVAILDIDGHRGDGTQTILKNEPNLLLVSIHQKDAYGGNGEKFHGDNAINLVLEPRVSEEKYLEALDEAISYIKEFNPDIVGISAGFDTYKEDVLLEFDLDVDSYYKIGKKLSENFDNMFAWLSGGYHNKVKDCVKKFIDGINSIN